MLVCEVCGFSIHVLNFDKVYLVVFNMSMVLNYNSLKLHVQLKFDIDRSNANEMSYFLLSAFKENFQSFLWIIRQAKRFRVKHYTFRCFYRRKIAANALIFWNGTYHMFILNFYFHHTQVSNTLLAPDNILRAMLAFVYYLFEFDSDITLSKYHSFSSIPSQTKMTVLLVGTYRKVQLVSRI